MKLNLRVKAVENNEQKREELYKFFKDNLNIDFHEFSSVKARMVVDELNKRLDAEIIEEQEKNRRLIEEIYNERKRIMELTQELYG